MSHLAYQKRVLYSFDGDLLFLEKKTGRGGNNNGLFRVNLRKWTLGCRVLGQQSKNHLLFYGRRQWYQQTRADYLT